MDFKTGVASFSTFDEAMDVAASEVRGFPGWRIVRHGTEWVIEYYPSGPHYPELQYTVGVWLDSK